MFIQASLFQPCALWVPSFPFLKQNWLLAILTYSADSPPAFSPIYQQKFYLSLTSLLKSHPFSLFPLYPHNTPLVQHFLFCSHFCTFFFCRQQVLCWLRKWLIFSSILVPFREHALSSYLLSLTISSKLHNFKLKKMLTFIKMHLYRKLVSTFKKIILNFINIHFHVYGSQIKVYLKRASNYSKTYI